MSACSSVAWGAKGADLAGRGSAGHNHRTETHGQFGPTLVQALSNLCPGIFAYMLE